ncbi:TspO/MBR family protein [Latilactobacillus sakei]|uniref:Tryptophan-rich sensory protein n=1 Tax=Latilactobacillus sakei TaxID=1599 RepID=A0AAF0GSK9_LATSK|nr:tryptophan-rich sensory protein [Latilactobacillus sakei]WGI20203.1 tryptophan-rich sensory protein [Latilactobacillus sakei]
MVNKKNKYSILGLLLFIMVIEAIGGLSGLFAGDIKGIYNGLSLPPLAPPDYLFGIVWPLLYALIAIAGYLIYKNFAKNNVGLLAGSFYSAQIILNFVWSIIFFRGYYWTGLVVILILDVLVITCINYAAKLNKVAGLLLMPYLVWLIFATYLTVAVAILNQ